MSEHSIYAAMPTGNVVITTHKHGYSEAIELLRGFGQIERTNYYNVLILKVEDIKQFLEDMRTTMTNNPPAFDCLARVVPVTVTFTFQGLEEFERRVKELAAPWASQLINMGFHVRMHRRGFKKWLSSQEEEQFLDRFLLAQCGGTTHIDFDKPDFIIAVETIDAWAGMSLWSQHRVERYPFMHLD